MLTAIRERAQGWIAWAIVILISIPFALWGVQEYLGIGAEPVVAKIGSREITQRELDTNFQSFRINLRERLGAAYDPALIDDEELRKQVLESMIRRDVVLQAAVDMGMRASDDLVRSTIAGIPSFRSNGGFDRAAYERNLRYQGLSPTMFEQRIRASIISTQLESGIRDSAFVTPSEAREILRLRQQRRGLAYLVLPAERYRPDEPPSDEAIAAYYSEHPKQFVAPERVRLSYIELNAASLAQALSPDEADLREYFELNRAEFVAPEQRRARHILIAVDESADPEAVSQARARAQAIMQRLSAGESFDVLAAEVSDDPGSAAEGGDLGWFQRGVMDPAFEEAVFAMDEGEVKGPVRSAFGFHIIELTGVREPKADFAAMKDQVRAAYAKRESERLYYEYAERLGNLTYENPDSLEPAAEALGLEVRDSDWITRGGGSGPLSSPKVTSAAFSDDVLAQRFNSEPIELEPEHVVVLRVAEHEAERQKTLDEVRDQIAEQLQEQRAAERARRAGEEMLGRLRAGQGLEAAAAELDAGWQTPGLIGRDASGIPPGVLNSAFRLPKPAEGEKTFGSAELPGGDFAVIAVDEVREGGGEAADAPRQNALVAGVARARGDRR
ncbi:MAG: SurA N-terminal domain-containing protein, partial [Chromatiales bacterium]